MRPYQRIRPIRRIKFWVIILAVPLCAACGRNVGRDAATNANSRPISASPSTPPYSTKEPATFQATLVVTSELAPAFAAAMDSGGGTYETFIAKEPDKRRTGLGPPANSGAYSLDLPNGSFIVLPSDKVYARIPPGDGTGTAPSGAEISPQRLLSDDTSEARYELIGKEQVEGRELTRYKVSTQAQAGVIAESLVWVDETLGMPIKVETVSGLDAQNRSKFTVELRDPSLKVDPSIFQIPTDYKEVDFEALYRKLYSGESKRK